MRQCQILYIHQFQHRFWGCSCTPKNEGRLNKESAQNCLYNIWPYIEYPKYKPKKNQNKIMKYGILINLFFSTHGHQVIEMASTKLKG
jgi:hypothetical protein